jgi:hypothetical protein
MKKSVTAFVTLFLILPTSPFYLSNERKIRYPITISDDMISVPFHSKGKVEKMAKATMSTTAKGRASAHISR